MSNALALLSSYDTALDALKRKEPVAVTLPNGTTIEAVPELIEHPDTGEPLIQMHVRIDGKSGPMEAQVRMSPETFEKSLATAERARPKIGVMLRQRPLLR
jgi:hypothetical protein